MIGRLIGEDVAVTLRLSRRPRRWSSRRRGQIEQVVLNLAVNARDAMPRGGTLTIETAHVELDDQLRATHFDVGPGAYVALTVSDTGIGMSAEVQAHLFEPFFTTKEVGKGTGLGLATVHGIVARCGGSVGVYSEVGKGTSFRICLPRAKTADAAAVASPAPQPARAAGETVLVVEDAENLRALTERLLKGLGYQVLLAANAAEALRICEQARQIDVLLTDVVMPGASGPELVQSLVARRSGLKVVYMSGYTEDVIVHHGVLRPGVMFLHKPFTKATLAAKLREALGG